MQKSSTMYGFFAGMLAGLVLYQLGILFGGFSLVSRTELERQQSLLAELKQENHELTDELFRPRYAPYGTPDEGELPYDGNADASGAVAKARENALLDKKLLMVTFGANWCLDCRTLYRNLQTEEVKEYTGGRFHFVNVDVGKFNQNRHVADELGVDLTKGIPVAIFFDQVGGVIGTTNEGQLEPARLYSSRQILKFVRDIAERSRIQAPDAVD